MNSIPLFVAIPDPSTLNFYISSAIVNHLSVAGDGLYEMESAKPKIIFDLLLQLGYHILQLAKLCMLQFRFDFLVEYCKESDFEYLEMDTDSAYMAIAGKSVEDIVNPAKQQALYKQKFGNCNNHHFTAADGFFPRECCDKHKAYDKRIPGLFKVEAEGNAMIALCSKTYILRQSDGKIKHSAKGLNRSALIDAYQSFKCVLDTKQTQSVINQGFCSLQNTIFTYEQQRAGLSYFYCKRE